MNIEQNIKNYIDSGNPCIFLRTKEYEKAHFLVEKILGKNIYKWKNNTGLFKNKDPFCRECDFNTALVILSTRIIHYTAIFYNPNLYISKESIQNLIDTIIKAKESLSIIFFVGPELNIPIELEDLITTIDIPLPSRVELREKYIEILKENKKVLKLPKEKSELDKYINNSVEASLGLSSQAAENAFTLSLATTGTIDIDIINNHKKQEVKKSEVLEFLHTDESIDTLGGFNKLKEWLRLRKKAFTKEGKEFGLQTPKGILLTGIPGVGKSLCAKVVSSYLKIPLIKLDLSSVYSSFVGESENKIRNALKIIDSIGNCVLWIDEIEKGLAGSQRSDLDSGVGARILSTLLTWRQETKSSCFIVATANNIDLIPSSLVRKGRFDEIWAVDLPDKETRFNIFKIHLKKLNKCTLFSEIEIDNLARQAIGFVGSEIEESIKEAMFYAFDANDDLNFNYVEKVINNIIPYTKRNKNEVEKFRNWAKYNSKLVE